MPMSLRLLLLVVVLAVAGCERHEFETLEGDRGSFDALQDHWIVINYWASWCLPCREEIPELNALSRRFAEDTKVFAVNFDGLQGEELAAEAEAMGIEFALLRKDPAPVLGYPRPQVLPTTVIIRPGGEVAASLSGPQTLATLAKAMGRGVSDG